VPVVDDDGEIVEWFGFASDVTERKRAEKALRHEFETTKLLLEAADALSASTDLDEMAASLADVVRRALCRERVTIWLYDEETDTAVTTGSGIKDENPARMRVQALAPQTRQALAEKKPAVIDYRSQDIPPLNRQRAAARGHCVVLTVPFVVKDRLAGYMSVDDPDGCRPFSERDIDIANGIASQAAVAIENAQLFAERGRQASYAESLNRINAAVHSSLEFDEIMNRVVVEVTRALGVDASAVHMRLGDHWEFTHSYNLPPGMMALRLTDEQAKLSMRVRETREPVVANDVLHDDRANVRLMERFGITSLIGVPLFIRGQTIGVLFTGCTSGSRDFSAHHVDFVVRAAATLALALENARLYQIEHDIADRLQTALLVMPDEVRGIELAHAYHSATEAARVGGDFFDVFEFDDDHIGITLGDVAGKGLQAAVLTSMVKNTIRAHASEPGKTPRQILGLTNQLVYRATPSESFVTVFFGVLDCRDGHLIYASAGHTTGGLVCRDSSATRLPATGPVLGALQDVEFEQTDAHLGLGETLFLYTDGLTEARQGGRMYGEERLFTLLAASKAGTAEELVAEVVSDLIGYSGEHLRDDVAILALKRADPELDAIEALTFEI